MNSELMNIWVDVLLLQDHINKTMTTILKKLAQVANNDSTDVEVEK